MDTLDSTFSLFFGSDDEPEPRACTDCGSRDDLAVLFTRENGIQVWICSKCEARREREARERREREAARVAAWAARDEWEE